MGRFTSNAPLVCGMYVIWSHVIVCGLCTVLNVGPALGVVGKGKGVIEGGVHLSSLVICAGLVIVKGSTVLRDTETILRWVLSQIITFIRCSREPKWIWVGGACYPVRSGVIPWYGRAKCHCYVK